MSDYLPESTIALTVFVLTIHNLMLLFFSISRGTVSWVFQIETQRIILRRGTVIQLLAGVANAN